MTNSLPSPPKPNFIFKIIALIFSIYDLIFDGNNKWMLSANGTIFTYEYEAVIPGLLKRWYEERQDMQRKMRDCGDNEIEREYWDKRQLVKKINFSDKK